MGGNDRQTWHSHNQENVSSIVGSWGVKGFGLCVITKNRGLDDKYLGFKNRENSRASGLLCVPIIT